MENKIKKLFVILFIIFLIITVFSLKINADDININEIKPIVDPYNNRITSMTETILGIIQVIGSITSIIVLIIIGIKYVSLSIEERVQYRKSMVPYIIGCFLVFSTSNIVNFIYNASDSLLHDYDTGTVIEYPTCYREGKKLYSCRDCAKTKVEIIAKDESQHDWTNKVRPTDGDISVFKAVDATCTDSAKYYYACGNYNLGCRVPNTTGGTFSVGSTDMTKHDWKTSGEVLVPATCVEGGWSIYECRRNAAHKKTADDIPPDPNAHDFENLASPQLGGAFLKSEATCKSKAIYYYACGNYNLGCMEPNKNKTFEAGDYDSNNHDGSWRLCEEETVAATCQTTGKKFYTCTGCNGGKEEKIPINPNAHDFENLASPQLGGEFLKSKATCKSKAIYYYACGNYNLGCMEPNKNKTFEAGGYDYNNHSGGRKHMGDGEYICTGCNRGIN